MNVMRLRTLATLTLAVALSGCGAASSLTTTSTTATSATATSAPSLLDVKRAIEATGVVLCDLTEPGNEHEYIFSHCSTPTPGGGLLYIFMGATRPDLQWVAGLNGKAWLDQDVLVYDEVAPRELGDALVEIGFTPYPTSYIPAS